MIYERLSPPAGRCGGRWLLGDNMKRYVPILLMLLVGCQTPRQTLLLGTWREVGSTNTIELQRNVAFLSPVLKLDYSVHGSNLVFQRPERIVLAKLAMDVFTNRTIVKEMRSRNEPPFSDWTVPFRVTRQALEIDWDGKPTSYFRVEQ